MDYMSRALELARAALGNVSPNPAVGAVVVRDGVAVGEGYTQPPGGAHAEIVALRQAGEAARGATMYVTLEPCCHHGRTPPCTTAIIGAGIAEVRMAMLDPDPKVDGKGKRELEEAGIRTLVGEGEAAARRINEAYIKHRTAGRPFVIAKFAASLDGRIAAASGDSRWVSGPQAREWAHHLRASVDAIMVGAGTVLADDPLLTARPDGLEGPHQPLRIVADSRGRTPSSSRVFTGPAPTIVVTTALSEHVWRQAVTSAGAEVIVLPATDGHVDLAALLQELGQRDILSLLVEGGSVLLGSFFDQGLVDKVIAIVAPLVIGGAGAPTAVGGRGAWQMADALRLEQVQVERLGEDILVTGYTPAPGPRTLAAGLVATQHQGS